VVEFSPAEWSFCESAAGVSGAGSVELCVDGQHVEAQGEYEGFTVVYLDAAFSKVAAAGRNVGLVQASRDRAGSITDDRRRLGRNVMTADVLAICFVESVGLPVQGWFVHSGVS
jgi:hypothetical protein